MEVVLPGRDDDSGERARAAAWRAPGARAARRGRSRFLLQGEACLDGLRCKAASNSQSAVAGMAATFYPRMVKLSGFAQQQAWGTAPTG